MPRSGPAGSGLAGRCAAGPGSACLGRGEGAARRPSIRLLHFNSAWPAMARPGPARPVPTRLGFGMVRRGIVVRGKGEAAATCASIRLLDFNVARPAPAWRGGTWHCGACYGPVWQCMVRRGKGEAARISCASIRLSDFQKCGQAGPVPACQALAPPPARGWTPHRHAGNAPTSSASASSATAADRKRKRGGSGIDAAESAANMTLRIKQITSAITLSSRQCPSGQSLSSRPRRCPNVG